jgi:hypothetical protein
MLSRPKIRRKKQRRGALTLEWILIITVLVIGVIGGLSMVRSAIVHQMHDMANSIISLQVTSQAELDANGLLNATGNPNDVNNGNTPAVDPNTQPVVNF